MNIPITVVGILMMLVIIALLLTKKLPMIPIFILVPLLTMFLLGYKPSEIGDVIGNSVFSSMTNIGLLLMFSITFFSTLSETGMFDRLVDMVVKAVGGNVYLILLTTIVVATIGHLDGSLVTTYLIAIPPLLPLYKKIGLDRRYLLFLTMMVTCSFFPEWGGVLLLNAGAAGVDAHELAIAIRPVMVINYALTVACSIWFGRRHMKAHKGIVQETVQTGADETKTENNPMLRPHLFWVNICLIVLCIICSMISGMPTYIVFMIFLAAALCINYRSTKDVNYIIKKYAPSYLNPMMLIVSINVLVGMMGGTGITKGIAELVISLIPDQLTQYAFIILALFIVPVCHFIPYQVVMALYPFIIAISEPVGISGVTVMVPFTANLIFGSGCSRYVAQTHLGVGLITGNDGNTEQMMDHFIKLSFPLCMVANVASIAIAVLIGAY